MNCGIPIQTLEMARSVVFSMSICILCRVNFVFDPLKLFNEERDSFSNYFEHFPQI